MLKELMTDCDSFHTAKAVSVESNRADDNWQLNLSWVPYPTENECLKKIVTEHGLEMLTSNERTIFRSV